MHHRHCPDCGALLADRELGDEGAVPFCSRCQKPWFDVFPTAVIALVYDEKGEVLLLRQNYISDVWCNLVSGYMKPGETAELCAIREIEEETGQIVEKLDFVCTNWFEKKQMLMIGFFAKVTRRPLRLSGEVDSAQWVKAEDAPKLVHQRPTSTSRILAQTFLTR